MSEINPRDMQALRELRPTLGKAIIGGIRWGILLLIIVIIITSSVAHISDRTGGFLVWPCWAIGALISHVRRQRKYQQALILVHARTYGAAAE